MSVVSEEVEDVGADLSFRVAQLYHWLSNELGQDSVAFLINHALELVGELSFYNKLLGDKCRSEDTVAVAKEVLNALVRAVVVALSEDPEPDKVAEADSLIIRAQAVLYNKARACLGLEH